MAVFGCHFEHERPGHPIGRDIQDIGKEFLILFYYVYLELHCSLSGSVLECVRYLYLSNISLQSISRVA
jgi:hypothetical protein